MIVEERFELPLADVLAEHAADGIGVEQPMGRLDEFTEEVLAWIETERAKRFDDKCRP